MMPFRNNKKNYGWLSMLLHWSMAGLIFWMIGLGVYMTDFSEPPEKFSYYLQHKSIGVIILIAALIRLGWRWSQATPGYPQSMPSLHIMLAHLGHYGLYFFMLLMPISGILMSQSAGFPVRVFDWFSLPTWVAASKSQAELFETIHEISAWVLCGLITAHIGAALFHHIIKKDSILTRMLYGKAALLLAITLSWPSTGHTAPAQYEIDPQHSSIAFTAYYQQQPVTGHFSQFEVNIHFDPQQLENSQINATIHISSLITNPSDMSVTLLDKAWLHSNLFPQAQFTSHQIQATDQANHYIAQGTLTLHGISRPIDLPFTLTLKPEQRTQAVAKITLQRSDFKIGAEPWEEGDKIDNRVDITITLDTKKQ